MDVSCRPCSCPASNPCSWRVAVDSPFRSYPCRSSRASAEPQASAESQQEQEEPAARSLLSSRAMTRDLEFLPAYSCRACSFPSAAASASAEALEKGLALELQRASPCRSSAPPHSA